MNLRRPFDALGMAGALTVVAVVLFVPASAWSSSQFVVVNTSDGGAGDGRHPKTGGGEAGAEARLANRKGWRL